MRHTDKKRQKKLKKTFAAVPLHASQELNSDWLNRVRSPFFILFTLINVICVLCCYYSDIYVYVRIYSLENKTNERNDLTNALAHTFTNHRLLCLT